MSCCYDGDSCIKTASNQKTDLLIIDIDLGKENGIDVANNIYTNNPSIKVIFITAYGKKYYDNIYDGLKPHGYIDKPIQENILKFFIKQIEEETKNNSQILSFSYDKKTYNIPLNSICYLQSDKRVCLITTQNATYRCYAKLSEIENKLTSEFLRCHHSFIVNTKQIFSICKREITLKNNVIIPISNSYVRAVQNWQNKK